jgi:phosphoserine phosphatase
VTVFDFDKTLTYHDTLFGFYREVDGHNPLFGTKKAVLMLAAIGYKLRLISNTTLKQIGVRLFLAGKSRAAIEAAGAAYADRIRLTELYQRDYLTANERLVVSASFEEYLRFVFPGDHVIGSQIEYRNDRAQSLKTNMYGETKRQCLLARGIREIDVFFTDSWADKPVMEMARKTFIVKNGTVESEILAGG